VGNALEVGVVMAGYAFISKLQAELTDRALQRLQSLLPEEDDGGREAEGLEVARVDVVARHSVEFKQSALVAALVRVIEAQAEEIEKLRRTKASAAAVGAVKKEIKK
jgi:hypothetical protein